MREAAWASGEGACFTLLALSATGGAPALELCLCPGSTGGTLAAVLEAEPAAGAGRAALDLPFAVTAAKTAAAAALERFPGAPGAAAPAAPATAGAGVAAAGEVRACAV